jgi:hypothetical protein
MQEKAMLNISTRNSGLLGAVLAVVLTAGCSVEEQPESVGKLFASLADPSHVSFKLEGCRNDGSFTLPNPNKNDQFICDDPFYTTGNLGKGWNELDLVPHRMTATTGKAAPATQQYTVALAVDNKESGIPGYDAISEPVLNTALSDPSCKPPMDVGSQLPAEPGIGGTDITLYRKVNFEQGESTTCVYDFYARLALGSHLYPGSSLHANLTNQNLKTSGIGAKDVSIPVKEIKPQELSKTMTAVQGTDHVWNITKEGQPATVTFGDTCSPNANDRQHAVTLTVTWKKLPATPSGAITVVTNISATNHAHRTITVVVCDDIRAGLLSLNKTCFEEKDVPANETATVATHTVDVPADSTNLNDVATATYIDKITKLEVPGQTEAKASADVQLTGPELNQTATILDNEAITGAGLSFSADGFVPGDIGQFLNSYVPGTPTTAVDWQSIVLSGDGSVVFNKTVYVEPAVITSGELADTAALTGSDGFTAAASADVDISADAKVSLTINKTIPDILSSAEREAFCFEVKGDAGAVVNTTISFAGGETSKSTTLTGLAPDIYTVTELTKAQCPEMLSDNWQPTAPQTVNLKLDRGCQGLECCENSASFVNTVENAKAQAKKVTIPAGAEAGWELTLKKDGVVVETVTTTGPDFVAFSTELGEGSYTIEETQKPLYEFLTSDGCSFTVDLPADAGKTFSCTFTNRYIPVGKIAPTQTTCQDFVSGTVMDLVAAEYQASAGLISNATPGVFFYYTKVTAPGPACFTVDVKQAVNDAAFSPSHLFEVQQAPATSQIKVYDANCTTSTLGTASVTSRGQVQVVVCGATAGAELIVSVKYETKSIVGLADPDPTALHYDFSTDVDGNTVDMDADGLNLVKK